MKSIIIALLAIILVASATVYMGDPRPAPPPEDRAERLDGPDRYVGDRPVPVIRLKDAHRN